MPSNRSVKLAPVFLCATALAVMQPGISQAGSATAHDQIGDVNFDTSCDPAVNDDFNRALARMHHMMYEQARAEFKTITEKDPECAMAHWGIATTLFQPLWPTRPDAAALQRGQEAIQKADMLKSATEREQLLVDATAAFFREPQSAGYSERISRWAEGMAAAYQQNANDLDTATLYALSRLALAQQADNSDVLHDEAEKILRAAWEKNPRHPGAVHYTIHATDADGRAHNALDIVKTYGEIAPSVPHALHMPSHIYVRLGDWPAVIDWNQRSADAALEEKVNGSISHHYLHAADYLLYAYLQQGEDSKAANLYAKAKDKARHQPTFISAFHLAAMPARLAIEQRAWQDAIALEPGAPEYLPWDSTFWPLGITWFARGLGAAHTGDPELARQAQQKLEELREQAKARGEPLFATYLEVDRRILEGWIAQAEGHEEEAERLLRAAAELESTVEKPPVSPGALLPAHEALGDLLLEQGRPQEALEAYRRSDAVWPGRFNTLLGAARAADQAGETDVARKRYRELLEVAGNSERGGIDEAQQSLAGR